MTYDTLDKDDKREDAPLFTDINIRTQRYAFHHPNSLLFATQFAQIALVVTEKAAFDDMHSKGLIQCNSAFTSHSLGEYSALALIADVLLISLVDVVFYRGTTMQSAIDSATRKTGLTMLCVPSTRAASAKPSTELLSVRLLKLWAAALIPSSRL